MVFPSFIFLFAFLPTFLALYYALPATFRNLWLFLASIVFYGWEKPEWVLIMLFSTVMDYTFALLMGAKEENRPHRKLWMIASVVANLSLLGWFKYANLFVHTAENLTGSHWGWSDIVLPVGISFYTFQSMSYTIDVYWGQVPPTRSFIGFACYVTMFPQLVAGPIVRYRDVIEQVATRVHSWHLFSNGVLFFMIGMVKKVMVADAVEPLARAGFAMDHAGALPVWTALVAYSIQIYFDFSAYSDMAVGLGHMTGFTFVRNFDSPYQSLSITESWRRWHISLSTWLRDYLYVPLGGNRHGEWQTYRNLLLTMLLGGIWHGANWPFLCWGAYQGVWLSLERWNGRKALHAGLPRPLQMVCTYLIFTFGWSMFVARDFTHLGDLWQSLFGMHGFGSVLQVPTDTMRGYVMLFVGLFVALCLPNSWALLRKPPLWLIVVLALGFFVSVCHLLATDYIPFIYFQF
jgi:alginate O-acetyltransferase complex protein AlgI